MDKHWRLTGTAIATAALTGCASPPARLPPTPPVQSTSLEGSGAESTSFADTWKEAESSLEPDAAATPGVVVYGSVPRQQLQQAPLSPTVPCGLASLAWTLTQPEDAWRLVAPILPDQNVDACVRNIRGDSPDPLHLEK